MCSKLLFIKKEHLSWSRPLFEVQYFRFAPGFHSVGLPGFGFAETRLVTTGTMVYVGVPLDTEMGYQKQVQALKAKTSDELHAIASTPPSFFIRASPNTLVFLPSGYVILSFCLSVAAGIRWGTFPKVKGEHRRVLRSVSAMLEAYQSLGSQAYKPWMQYLLADPRSAASAAQA